MTSPRLPVTPQSVDLHQHFTGAAFIYPPAQCSRGKNQSTAYCARSSKGVLSAGQCTNKGCLGAGSDNVPKADDDRPAPLLSPRRWIFVSSFGCCHRRGSLSGPEPVLPGWLECGGTMLGGSNAARDMNSDPHVLPRPVTGWLGRPQPSNEENGGSEGVADWEARQDQTPLLYKTGALLRPKSGGLVKPDVRRSIPSLTYETGSKCKSRQNGQICLG